MIKVYSKTNCVNCDSAKQLLEQAGIQYEEILVDQDAQARQFLIDAGHRSVPQIYRDQVLAVPNGWQGLKQLDSQSLQLLKG